MSERVVVENNFFKPQDLPTGMADYGSSAFTLGKALEENGYTIDDINAALNKFSKGDHPEGQDPARGFLEAWGNMVGIPLDLFWSNQQMTPEKAAQILSGSVPTSEAKLIQYMAAKSYLAFVKSGKGMPSWDAGTGQYSFKESKLSSNPTSQSSSGAWKPTDSNLYVDGVISNTKAKEIINVPHGQRPDPSTYMTKSEIDAHLAKFDDGAVRFTSKNSYNKFNTAGPDGGFVMPAAEFDRIMVEAKGNLSVVEKKLGLDKGYLSNSDTMAVYIKKEDFKGLKMPSGNEPGANQYWTPGGKTSGGISEVVMDFSHKPKVEIVDINNYKKIK